MRLPHGSEGNNLPNDMQDVVSLDNQSAITLAKLMVDNNRVFIFYAMIFTA